MYWCVLAVAFGVLLATPGVAGNLVITTTHGPIRGILDDELQIRSFRGVPYGALDHENRFKAPQELENWNDILDTHEFTKICPQTINNEYAGVEDCLVLNVFAPAEGEGLPVLFHVHGGELQRGSASPDVYGPQRIVPRGIILVVPNYRLGALGFMCLRDEVAPGNAGLKDLELAVKWVHDNIHEFGGDPDDITVSGEGTGGGAAGFLTISPNTKDMISKLITESGSSLSPWIMDRNPVNRARNFVVSLAEKAEDADDPTFLRELDVKKIVDAVTERGDLFRVCVESSVNNTDAFLTSPPYHIMRNTNLSITAMIGYANGAGMREAAAQTASTMESLDTNFYSLLPPDLIFPSTTSRSNAALMIKNQYFGEEPITINKREEYMRYYTDAVYLGPALRVARLFAVHSSVFFYEFGYDGGLNHAKDTLNPKLAGAARGDIAGYVFTHKAQPEDMDVKDKLIADKVLDLWSSFIITGTPSLSEGDSSWPPLTSENNHVMNITGSLQMGEDIHPERLAMWEDLYATNYVDCPSSASIETLFAPLLLLSLCIYALCIF